MRSLSCFFVSKIKQENIVKMRHAFVPRAFYLEAIKLNKENNTSLVVTLVNYVLRIISVIFFIFSGFCIFCYFLNGISGLSLFTECFLHNYSTLRKCWMCLLWWHCAYWQLNHCCLWKCYWKKKCYNVIDLQFKSKVRYMSPCLLIHLDTDFFFLITNARAWA